MGIPINRLHLTGRGVTLADIETALARAPGAAPSQGEIGGEMGGDGEIPSGLRLAQVSPIAASLPPEEAVLHALGTLPDRYAGMNRGERKYASEVLDPMLRSGALLAWMFEAVKLKLAPRCFYTPDFLTVWPDRSLLLYDVKGRKGDGWWAEEDARIKLRLAAHLFPFPLIVVWPLKGGGWGEERIGPTRGR